MIKVITPVTEEPITIEEARKHLEAQPYFDSDLDLSDDNYIMAQVGAAREHCENFCGLSFAPRTIEVAFDRFPTGTRYDWPFPTNQFQTWFDLPWGPVTEVISISYGSGPTVVDPATYFLDEFHQPNRIYAITDASWPTGWTAAPNLGTIRYSVGYTAEQLPKAVRSAILLTLGSLFANREDFTNEAANSVPLNAEALLRPIRVRLGMA